MRLLGSPNDSEALAAARALQRTLKSAGADLHALADVVEKPPAAELSESDMKRIWDDGRQTGIQEGLEQARDLGVFKPVGSDPTPHEMAAYCQQNIKRIPPQHHQFIDDMASRTLRPWFTPSVRQAEYLKSMYHQAGGGR